MSLKILIVDDAQFMRNRLAEIITEAGWQVVGQAGNGRDAISLVREFRPDVVLTDVTMPELDGREFVRAMLREAPKTRIVVCSAVSHPDTIVEILEEGALDFVLKPFQPDRLKEAVRKAAGDLLSWSQLKNRG